MIDNAISPDKSSDIYVFLWKLYDLFFPEGVDGLVFVVACALMGLLVVLLDILVYKIRGQSYLKLVYSGWQTFILIAFWGLGAGLGGMIGSAIGILEYNLAATVTVGVGWPFILPRAIDATGMREEEQASTEEEEEQ